MFVRAWEFRAGTYVAGKDTVHHMCGGVRPPGFVENPADDAEGEGAAGLSMGCIAGGAEPAQLPEGFGMELKKGSTITFNMHYYKQAGAGTGYWNQAEVGFYFAKGPIKYKVKSKSIGTTGFEIPPHKVNYRIGAAETLQKDTLYLAYWPHAHLRATAARYTATYPDGRKEVLLDVPRYDQGWQVTYKFKQPKLLPKGTRIDVEMLYDNSADRGAKRLFNPNLAIRNGPRTQDEMMLGFVSYAELEPGQEVPTAAAAGLDACERPGVRRGRNHGPADRQRLSCGSHRRPSAAHRPLKPMGCCARSSRLAGAPHRWHFRRRSKLTIRRIRRCLSATAGRHRARSRRQLETTGSLRIGTMELAASGAPAAASHELWPKTAGSGWQPRIVQPDILAS